MDKDEEFVNGDPQFINATNADFHIEDTSPAINNGTTEDFYNTFYVSLGVNVTFDLDGNTRPKHGVYDIGVYETDVPVGVKETGNQVPTTYSLKNYPNPFNPTTNIQFELPVSSHVTLEIYNYIGERIVTLLDEAKNAGEYQTEWNGKNSQNRNVASGVYIYRMQAGSKVLVNKMMLLR